MAACGSQACAEEKVDKPKRLFNYKPAGVKAKEYVPFPSDDTKYDNLQELVDAGRKYMDSAMEQLTKIPIFVDAMEKNVTTKLTVKKGDISDGDITVYIHRPKNLPKKGCPAMIFAHGGGCIVGKAESFVPAYAFKSLMYEVVGFNVDYRLAPEHGNKGGTDMYAVLKYVYNNAEELGIDKTRIGMEGESAGSHHIFNAMNLAAPKGETGMCKMILSDIGMFTSVLHFTPQKDRVGEEAIAGPDLVKNYTALFGEKFKDHVDSKDPMLFPELVEEEKLKLYPPVVIFSAEFCLVHKGNKLLAQRLENVGKLLEFRLIRGLGHMHSASNNDETAAAFKDRVTCVDVYLKK